MNEDIGCGARGVRASDLRCLVIVMVGSVVAMRHILLLVSRDNGALRVVALPQHGWSVRQHLAARR